MQIKTQIKAIFFLSIFSLIMLHNALANLHHLTEDSSALNEHMEESHNDHHHDHSHSHSPKKEQKQESDSNFFRILLENHSHTNHSHAFFELGNMGAKNTKAKYLLIGVYRENPLILLHTFKEPQKRFRPYHQRLRPRKYLFNPSLRAPPVLVVS
ncbi:hypothetical protein [Xanthovirga aplysinae]|uniref:hypothetical protein n=1 Tax=Xanthovirga aplysinae TaxID=2529853 RepID=UPI0012BB8317|nr:hypothetical protein [Xanthovirga aplysinae]MTI33024.1 hypothetical protein [Xanthovirga aplysinae]